MKYKKGTFVIEPNYWIKYYGLALPLPAYLSNRLFELKLVKLKKNTKTNELKWTKLGLKELKKC